MEEERVVEQLDYAMVVALPTIDGVRSPDPGHEITIIRSLENSLYASDRPRPYVVDFQIHLERKKHSWRSDGNCARKIPKLEQPVKQEKSSGDDLYRTPPFSSSSYSFSIPYRDFFVSPDWCRGRLRGLITSAEVHHRPEFVDMFSARLVEYVRMLMGLVHQVQEEPHSFLVRAGVELTTIIPVLPGDVPHEEIPSIKYLKHTQMCFPVCCRSIRGGTSWTTL